MELQELCTTQQVKGGITKESPSLRQGHQCPALQHESSDAKHQQSAMLNTSHVLFSTSPLVLSIPHARWQRRQYLLGASVCWMSSDHSTHHTLCEQLQLRNVVLCQSMCAEYVSSKYVSDVIMRIGFAQFLTGLTHDWGVLHLTKHSLLSADVPNAM